MPASAELRFRAACPGDAQAIAALHADSWQRHYRGAFSDAFLDHDAAGYLLPLWTARLATPAPRAGTILAERDGTGVALPTRSSARTPPERVPRQPSRRIRAEKTRISTRLLAQTAQAVLDASPASGLYLWVLEQNSDARAAVLIRVGFAGVYRFRTRRKYCDLRFGRMSWLRQDRGLCPFACST